METVVKVQNIKCSGCANTIANKLERIHGVETVKVIPEEGEVKIHCHDETDLAAAIFKLKQLGYPLDHEANTFANKASSYLSCALGRMSN
ncbi:MAG: heavy metal-associated domain-containing protein [Gilvibacter sp.]